MLPKSVQEALNDQIKNELASAHLYLSMCAYFESASLPGFAHWMKVQSREETEHAMKFFEYVHERGGRVTLKEIPAPPTKFSSPQAAFDAYLEHEKKVTALVNGLYETATKANDYATQVTLHWFIKEQVEEEKTGMEIVDQMKMIGDNKTALLMLDRQLNARASKD